MEEYIKNTQHEILSPSGWKSFSGMRKLSKEEYGIISTANTKIKCSLNHQLKTTNGWKKSKELLCDDVIINNIEESSPVSFVEIVKGKIDLFDILEVENHEYYSNGLVSHNCDFIGSQHTLISSYKLKSLAWITPMITHKEGLCIYEEPKEDHTYTCSVDTARGQGLDYSAFTILDVTEMPYRVVAKYRNNIVSPMVYPTIIKRVCEQFNHAWCLIEINDIGGQVADILHYDLEYGNILQVQTKGRKGQVIGGGFGTGGSMLGVRTTSVVKKIGCSVLKSLIEEDKLIIEDLDTIDELTTFVAKKQSFEADDGHTDDLVMSLVLFAWLTRQAYFKDITNTDVRTSIYQEKIEELEEDMSPFGFMPDSEEDAGEWDGESRWFTTENNPSW